MGGASVILLTKGNKEMEYLDYLDDIYNELVDEFGIEITTKGSK